MKLSSKILCLSSALVIALTMLTGCLKGNMPHDSANGIQTIDDGKMRTKMTSAEYAKEMGIGINLGNTMESYWSGGSKSSGGSVIGENKPLNYETCWGAIETTQEAISGMKEQGFNTVRVPVYWGNMMEENTNFKINEDYFDRVEEIINYCRNEGLYVIINIHHYDEYLIKHFPKEEVIEIISNLWNQIANRYKEYSDYLVFEGFNEALGSNRESDSFTEDELFDYTNAMNKAFVEAVRATGKNNKNRLLIISGYWTNIDLTTDERYIIPTDTVEDRIMISVHYVDNACYWANKIGGEEWLEYSRAQCELLKKAFTDKGYTVFVGECTSIYSDDRFVSDAAYTNSADCLEVMMKMIVDYGFVPVLWDVNDNFYSRTEYKIKSPADAAVILEIRNLIEEKKF